MTFSGKKFHDCEVVNLKRCSVCKVSFRPRTGAQKTCSKKCKGKWKYLSGQETTETQYAKISGNWERYLSRLLAAGGKKREHITRDMLMARLRAQDYRCALSGTAMTCLLEKGRTFGTNVSVDRIDAGGPYTEDNIQLVCQALNKWRGDTEVGEFVEWCRRVAEHFDQLEEGARSDEET